MDQMWIAAENLDGFVPVSNLVVDGSHVMVIHVFTKVKWMDQITVTFHGEKKCKAMLVAESTGMLPLCVPFACVLNLGLFWCPFLDTNGRCGYSISLLRKEIEKISGKSMQSQTIRFSRSVQQKKYKLKKE